MDIRKFAVAALTLVALMGAPSMVMAAPHHSGGDRGGPRVIRHDGQRYEGGYRNERYGRYNRDWRYGRHDRDGRHGRYDCNWRYGWNYRCGDKGYYGYRRGRR